MKKIKFTVSFDVEVTDKDMYHVFVHMAHMRELGPPGDPKQWTKEQRKEAVRKLVETIMKETAPEVLFDIWNNY